MALYVPLSRRRRNAALLAVAALAVGLIAGLVAGRSSAVTASERASEVRAEGNVLATRIEALTIEYEQAVAGTGDTIQGGVLDALDLIDADVDSLLAKAVWLGPAQAAEARSAAAAVRSAATSQVAVDEFATVTGSSATVIRDTFGVRG